ncbi:MAG: GNAT family N-acetyltransferase [Candidatus Micrarchaeia archaeon]
MKKFVFPGFSFRWRSSVVKVRPVAAKDVPAWVRITNEPEVFPWLLQPKKVTAASVAKRILRNRDRRRLVVEKDGRVVGLLGFTPGFGRMSHTAEFFIAFSHSVHGSGIPFQVMKRCFARLKKQGIRLLHAGFNARNKRGQRFYAKLGFKEYGALPKALKVGRNKFVDEVRIYKKL